MTDPVPQRAIEPGGGSSSRVWTWLGLLLIGLVALGYVTGNVPEVILYATLISVAGLLILAWGVRYARGTAGVERGPGGDPEAKPAGAETLAGTLWTLLWLALVVFDEAILARAADLIAWLVEPLGLPREETAETLEGLILSLAVLLMVWSWIAGWRESRRRKRAAMEELG